MTRPALIINGQPVPDGPRWRPPAPPAPLPPPVRPGCVPSCCGALHGGNGGHRNDHAYVCDYRTSRIFDHLDGEPEDRRFGSIAHAMRREDWWLQPSILVGLDDASGECGQ